MDICLEKVERQEQIDALCAIAEVVWHETYDTLVPIAQVDYMLNRFQSDSAVKEQLAHMGYRYYLLCCEKEYAGFVGFAPRYEGREDMFLSKIYVLSQFRGHGAVRKALSFVEEETRKEGLSTIRLTVNKGNSRAIAVYERLGFSIVDDVKSDIGSGFIMDDYIMAKEV